MTVSIGGMPADVEQVRGAVTLELYRLFHPLWGAADGDGWPFGRAVYPSEVMHRVQNVLPDGLIAARVFAVRDDQPDDGTDCEPRVIGAYRLPALTEVHVRFLPLAQQEGGLG